MADLGTIEVKKYSNKSALLKNKLNKSNSDIVASHVMTPRRYSDPAPYERKNASSEIACNSESLPTLENFHVIHLWERMVDDYLNANSMTLPDLAKHYLMLEEEESRHPDGFEKRIVVSIDAWWKFYWDIGIILLFVYSAFQVPYELAFDIGSVLDFSNFWQMWSMVMNCLYMMDIMLAFVTERYHEGLLVSRLRQISSLYLREEFALDFAGSFPFDVVVAAIVQSTGGTQVNLAAMRAFKLIRLLRLLRGAKIIKFVQALEEKTRGKLSRVLHLIQSVLVLIFTAHTLGCFFVLLASMEDSWNYDVNWLVAYEPDLSPDQVGTDQEYRRYVTCLYWAIITISTMGYGDVLPKTTPERCYVIMVALVGSVVFAYCMNNIGQMLSASSGIEDALRSNQRQVRAAAFSTRVNRISRNIFPTTAYPMTRTLGTFFLPSTISALFHITLRRIPLSILPIFLFYEPPLLFCLPTS